MIGPMRLVHLGDGDADLLDRAVRRFRGAPGADGAGFLADRSVAVLVALDGEEIAGWAWGWRQHHVCGYTQLQLYEIEVAPPWRRQGIGRQLLTAFLTIGRAEGHSKVYLFTAAGNLQAKALYEQLGGVAAGEDETGYCWQIS